MSDRRSLASAARIFLARCAETLSLMSGILLVSWSGSAAALASVTVYDLSATSGLSVSGTIATNGAIGTLSASDIIGWQINQTADTTHFVSSMNPSTSSVSLTGGALTATATRLFFDFGDTAGSKLAFTSNNFGANGGLSLQFCGTFAACLNQNNAPVVSSILLVLVAPGCCSTSGGLQQLGISEIAVTPAVPEPSTWATMLLGIGVVGWKLRRSLRRTAAGYLPLPA